MECWGHAEERRLKQPRKPGKASPCLFTGAVSPRASHQGEEGDSDMGWCGCSGAGRGEGMWDGKGAWNGIEAGSRFVPGSSGTLNNKARHQTSKCLLCYFKGKSFLLLVWRATV